MLDETTVEAVRRHWDEGWNAGDLDVIMASFAPDIVFSSPFLPRLTGDPANTSITGYDELRAYLDGALRRTPGIRYTVEGTFASADTVVLVYLCQLPDGRVKRGVDTMRVDPSGTVVEWRCHYTLDSMD